MGSTLIQMLLGLLIFLSIMLVVIWLSRRHKAHPARLSASGTDIKYLMRRNTYDIALYDYPENIRGIDDINALRVGQYRDHGKITSYGDAFYEFHFMPCEAAVFELSHILMNAKEVKRVDDVRSLYFFQDPVVRTITDETVKDLQHQIRQKMRDCRNILVIIDKRAEGCAVEEY